MTNRARDIALGVLVMSSVTMAGAEETTHESPLLELPASLRAVFVQEMQAVSANMQRIVSALPRADWMSLEEASRSIAGSFVLEQKLSASQRSELHRVLPEPFLALDVDFHDTADRLTSAARRRDAELATFYTYKLAEACVSCHARYALHRFPAFETEESQGH